VSVRRYRLESGDFGALTYTYANVKNRAVGGAMAWRINALGKPAMTQLGMDWGLCMASLVIALPMVWTVTNTSIVNEEVVVEADGTVANEEVKPVF